MLHAKQIEFIHPSSGNKMKIEAKLPEYFEEIIELLEKKG